MGLGFLAIGVVLVLLVVVAVVVTRRRPATQPARAMKTVEIRDEQDTPIGFGRKSLWIAARATDARSLAETLGLSGIQPSNWHSGILAAYAYPSDYVFVTPPLNGWVLAVGRGIPDPSDPRLLPRWRALMTAISQRFGEAQFFGSHRTSSYSTWARYYEGVEKRLFAYADELIYNMGEPLPEEAELMAHLLDSSSPEAENDAYWKREDLRTPEEEDVLMLAAAWSFDPSSLDSSTRPPIVGLVGHLLHER